jgi:hypothetical protein
MKKLLGLFAVLFLFGLPTFAQDTFEVGAGYAFRSFDQTIAQPSFRVNMNGFDVNGAFHLNGWLGVAGDVVGTYANQGVSGDNTLYSYMAGPRVYPFGHHRIAPYVQAEFGGAHYIFQVPGSPNLTQDGFAWAAGGGIDVFLGRHLGLKGQAQFEQTRFFQNANVFPGAGLQQNFVFVVGPVIRF